MLKLLCLGNLLIRYIFFIRSVLRIIRKFCRFPTEMETKQLWIEAVNKSNDEQHKTRGTGFVCNLHFLSDDIKKVSKGIRIKLGAIPVNFVSSIKQSIFEQSPAKQQDCNECAQLKHLLLTTNIDSDIFAQKANAQIQNLNVKIQNKSHIIKVLLGKIESLEKIAKEKESKIKELSERIIQHSDIKVNQVLIFNTF